jgi:hypothetical protein
MTRRASRCTQAEVTRLIRGAQAAGLPVCGVRLDGAGVTVLTALPTEPAVRDLEAASAELDRRLGIDRDGARENPLLPH